MDGGTISPNSGVSILKRTSKTITTEELAQIKPTSKTMRTL